MSIILVAIYLLLMQLFPQPVLSYGSGNIPPPSHPAVSQWHIHTDTLHQTALNMSHLNISALPHPGPNLSDRPWLKWGSQ